MSSAISNLLTVDVEDWHQSTLNYDLPVSARVCDNTYRVLDLLAARDVHATFFVLGLVVERFPEIVRRIVKGGHEVASHGWSHRPVYALGPDAFRREVRDSVAALQDETGTKVLGYRAPDFSIREDAFWAFGILAEEGIVYDSSIYPIWGRRYGIREAFRDPWRIRCPSGGELIELPLTTVECLGLRAPVAGGGYFRLLPYALTRAAIRHVNRSGMLANAYFHPYELDTREIPTSQHRIPLKLRVSQHLFRSRVESRLRRLLQDFHWVPARDLLSSVDALTQGRVLDLAGPSAGAPRWLADKTVA
jgi:polysaccharide deacetylase family protein (PEP-CTERM system associated)